MAKVVEDVVVVKFSKLVKDDETSVSIVSPEIQTAIEQVAQELVGDGVIVEVVKA
jgi:hypothetical protein